MKVGDLVTVVQSKTGTLVCPFVGQVGIIIDTRKPFARQEGFYVMLSDSMTLSLGSNYLEVINESR